MKKMKRETPVDICVFIHVDAFVVEALISGQFTQLLKTVSQKRFSLYIWNLAKLARICSYIASKEVVARELICKTNEHKFQEKKQKYLFSSISKAVR